MTERPPLKGLTLLALVTLALILGCLRGLRPHPLREVLR